jgi:hypothetical protein
MAVINDGWRFRLGDDPAYAQPGFDDSHWQAVTLRARPAIAGPGMRWYRLHLKLPAARPPLGLFLVLPKNGYEVFVNGTRAGDGRIGSALDIYRPFAQSVQLPAGTPDMVLAVRSMDMPYQDAAENMESLQFASVGLWPVVLFVMRSDLTDEVAFMGSSMAMDIAAGLGGLAVLGLFLIQRTRREYLWLCAYLMVASLSDLFNCLQYSFLPFWANGLFADPLCFVIPLLQVEFTYAFVGKRVGIAWRIYEAVLFSFFVAGFFTNWLGLIPRIYFAAQTMLFFPAGILLPVLLVLWFWRGHREAGWLILPSLFPPLSWGLFNAWYTVRDLLHSNRLNFLQPFLEFSIGYVGFRTMAIANLLFLLAIGVVIFLRHTKLTREQEKSAAELQAARTVQQILVPEEVPSIPLFSIQAVYHPAGEVGGDFYQVLPTPNGSLLAVIGDVSGKGMPAAMTVSLLVGTVRTLAHYTNDPAEVLTAMNQRLIGRKQRLYHRAGAAPGPRRHPHRRQCGSRRSVRQRKGARNRQWPASRHHRRCRIHQLHAASRIRHDAHPAH